MIEKKNLLKIINSKNNTIRDIYDIIQFINHNDVNVMDIINMLESKNKGIPIYIEKYNLCIKVIYSIKGRNAPKNLNEKEKGIWIKNKRIKLLGDLINIH